MCIRKSTSSVINLAAFLIIALSDLTYGWKYQTKCTYASSTQSPSSPETYSILEDFERLNADDKLYRHMSLKCPNVNDFLFIGLTQYGVRADVNKPLPADEDSCKIAENDCLVPVDYLANQCNGLNRCDIQLESQFLHSCKNVSDYLSVAYDCIPGSKRLDICSNQEVFLIDSSSSNTELNARFASLYLTSPNYPNEYAANLNNCSCRVEYISIDDGSGAAPANQNPALQMNLKLKSFEFDLEEGESSNCDGKDSLKIDSFDSNYSSSGSLNLCGVQKDFKEFYTSGNNFKLNFSTDDVISRRGFLMEISTVPQTICPFGTERFGSEKCVKFYDDNLSFSHAKLKCEENSARLLTITDFVDNLKLNNFLRTKIEQPEINVWSTFQLTKSSKNSKIDARFLNLKRNAEKNLNECLSKKVNEWQEVSCGSKLAYICEFDPIKLNKIEANLKNRLIRVSCGSLSNVYLKTTTTTTTTTIKPIQQKKQEPIKLLSWSSLLKPLKQPQTTTPTIPSLLLDIYSLENSKNQQEKLTMTKSTKNSTLLSQELILAIAIVSGISLVFILVNIFCIWNYYSKKLKAFIDKSETSTENYRTSTMVKSSNRSMSTVDSYVKVNPSCENSVNNELNMQPTCLLSNEQKINYLRSYFQTKKFQQAAALNEPHYYETLSTRHYNNYSLGDLCAGSECERFLRPFESIVVLPNNITQLQQQQQQSPATVLLLNHLNNNAQLVSEVSPSSSSVTSSSTNPLITFSSSSSSSTQSQQQQLQLIQTDTF